MMVGSYDETTKESQIKQSKNTTNDDFSKPILVLLHEQKYGLVLLSIVISASAFVAALSIRGIVVSCVDFMLGTNDGSFDKCYSSCVEGVVLLAIIMILASLIVRLYIITNHQLQQLNV